MRFLLLGTFKSHQADGTLIEVRRLKLRQLMALFLLNPGGNLLADELIDGLWETPPKSARGNLKTYVFALRESLQGTGAVLATVQRGYRLDGVDGLVDVTAFETLRREGITALDDGQVEIAAIRLQRALRLWRGPALSDVAGDSTTLNLHAGLLEDRRTKAALALATAQRHLGRYGEALDELRRLLGRGVRDERVWSELMITLAMDGRRDDALTAYVECRDLFGAEPRRRLSRLREGLLGA